MKLVNFECAHLSTPKDEDASPYKNDIMDACIRTGGIEIDLHNCYDLTGYTHDLAARSLTFHWLRGPIADDDIEYNKKMPEKLSLRFDGVWECTIEPRDRAYPAESDLHMMVIYLSDVEYGDDAEIPDWPEEARAHICIIDLESEQRFLIHAERAEAFPG